MNTLGAILGYLIWILFKSKFYNNSKNIGVNIKSEINILMLISVLFKFYYVVGDCLFKTK